MGSVGGDHVDLGFGKAGPRQVGARSPSFTLGPSSLPCPLGSFGWWSLSFSFSAGVAPIHFWSACSNPLRALDIVVCTSAEPAGTDSVTFRLVLRARLLCSSALAFDEADLAGTKLKDKLKGP